MAAVRLSPAVPKPSDPDQQEGRQPVGRERTTRNGLSPGLSARLDDRVTRGGVAGPCGNSEAALGPVPRPIRRSYPGSAYLMDVQSLQLTSGFPIPGRPRLPRRRDVDVPPMPPAPGGPAAGAVDLDSCAPPRVHGRLHRARPRRARVDDPDHPAAAGHRPWPRGDQPRRTGGRTAALDRVRARRVTSRPPAPRQLGRLDVPLPVRRRGDGPRRPDRGGLGGAPRDPRATRARVPALVRHARQPLGHGASARSSAA